MIAKELISYYIPSVSCSDEGDKAIMLMDEHKVSHIPIVDKGHYHGLLSEDEILDMEDTFVPIKDCKKNFIRPFVDAYAHAYDIIRVFAEFRLTVLPVLDEKENYLGVISVQDLAANFHKLTNAHEPGGILILGLNIRDYSLAQAAQIVESENAKILSSYVTTVGDSTKIDLTLKINKSDLTTIIAAFDRFNYEIKASFHESKFDEDLQRRYDQFMNYLNM